jgi:hypothetical protein
LRRARRGSVHRLASSQKDDVVAHENASL